MSTKQTPAPAAAGLSTPPVVPAPTTVRVKLVWPAARGPKIDCRAGTKIIWAGHGDVQDYPAALWHKLAPHPDVWQLVNKRDEEIAAEAQSEIVETPEQRLARMQDERRVADAEHDAEAARVEAEKAREKAAEKGADVVHARTDDSFDPPDVVSEHVPKAKGRQPSKG